MRLHLIITGYASNHNYAHAHIRADCARHGGFSHVIVEVSQSYLFISKTQKKSNITHFNDCFSLSVV